MLTTAVGGPPSSPWTTPRQRFQAAARQPHSSCGSHSTLCCPADVFMVHGLFAQNSSLLISLNSSHVVGAPAGWERALCRQYDETGAVFTGACVHQVSLAAAHTRVVSV